MAVPPAMASPVLTAPAPSQGTWYVRPSAGGQYGPADEPMLRQWIAERRVDAGALVWCAGWPDWRPLSEISGFLPATAAVAAPVAAQVATPPGFDLPASGAPAPAAVATARYIRRKKKSANGQLVAAGLLLLLALILGGVLLWVINKKPPQPTSPVPATPVEPAAPTPGEPADAEGADAEHPSME